MSMTIDGMIDVLRAHKDGKMLQSRREGSVDNWTTCKWPIFNFQQTEYRVAPAPVELYFNLTSDGMPLSYHYTRDDAFNATTSKSVRKGVLFREVI